MHLILRHGSASQGRLLGTQLFLVGRLRCPPARLRRGRSAGNSRFFWLAGSLSARSPAAGQVHKRKLLGASLKAKSKGMNIEMAHQEKICL